MTIDTEHLTLIQQWIRENHTAYINDKGELNATYLAEDCCMRFGVELDAPWVIEEVLNFAEENKLECYTIE